MKWTVLSVLLVLTTSLLPAQSLVADINPGSESSYPKQLFQVGTRLFFRAYSPGYGNELWTSDGTTAGTYKVFDFMPGPQDASISFLADLDGVLLFSADHSYFGHELWRSDGTKKGTFMVKDIYHGASSSKITSGKVLDGVCYFDATDGIYGKELWRTDGTHQGTWRISDTWPGTYMGLTWLTNGGSVCVHNGVLLFSASDPKHGRELWVSDGTTKGTRLLVDIDPGLGSGNPWSLTPAGPYVFFNANSGVWRTDGTMTGTIKLTSARSAYGRGIGSRYFFTGIESATGMEPWVSDGTPKGTVMLRDLAKGSSASWPRGYVNVNGNAYFTAFATNSTYDIWKSDGTSTGTVHLMTLRGEHPWNAEVFAADAGSRFAMAAYDSVHGTEPWISDGTMKGTRMIKDINPGAAGAAPYEFVTAGSKVYYVADDGVHGCELWATELADIGGAGLSSIGRGCSGFNGEIPTLKPVGLPQLGNQNFSFVLDRMFPWGQVDLNIHIKRSDLMIDGCTFYVPSPIVVLQRPTQAGELKISVPIPLDPVLAGLELFVQGVVLDLYGSVHGVAATTKAWEVVIGR